MTKRADWGDARSEENCRSTGVDSLFHLRRVHYGSGGASVRSEAAGSSPPEPARFRPKILISFYPFPVIAELADGNTKSALCYTSFGIPISPAEPDYVNELARRATELGAPEAYIAHINSLMQR